MVGGVLKGDSVLVGLPNGSGRDGYFLLCCRVRVCAPNFNVEQQHFMVFIIYI